MRASAARGKIANWFLLPRNTAHCRAHLLTDDFVRARQCATPWEMVVARGASADHHTLAGAGDAHPDNCTNTTLSLPEDTEGPGACAARGPLTVVPPTSHG